MNPVDTEHLYALCAYDGAVLAVATSTGASSLYAVERLQEVPGLLDALRALPPPEEHPRLIRRFPFEQKGLFEVFLPQWRQTEAFAQYTRFVEDLFGPYLAPGALQEFPHILLSNFFPGVSISAESLREKLPQTYEARFATLLKGARLNSSNRLPIFFSTDTLIEYYVTLVQSEASAGEDLSPARVFLPLFFWAYDVLTGQLMFYGPEDLGRFLPPEYLATRLRAIVETYQLLLSLYQDSSAQRALSDALLEEDPLTPEGVFTRLANALQPAREARRIFLEALRGVSEPLSLNPPAPDVALMALIPFLKTAHQILPVRPFATVTRGAEVAEAKGLFRPLP